MIVATTENVPGYRLLRYVGFARGCAVRGASAQEDILALMKNQLGGEVHEYTQILAATREQAIDRLMDDARQMGANAVIGVRLGSSDIGSGLAEVIAYGTAVVVEKAGQESP